MSHPENAPLDFQTLFEEAPSLFLVLEPNDAYPILATSNAYLQATMTQREDLVGRPLFEAFPENPDDPLPDGGPYDIRAALAQVRRTRQPEILPPHKYYIRRPEENGARSFEERFWRTTVSPVLNAEGGLRFIICRTEDVTTQLSAQRELDDARSRLEATLAAGEIGTWIWEIEKDLVYADRNLARYFGVAEKDAAGGPIDQYLRAIHEEDQGRVIAAVSKAASNGSAYEVEYRIVRPDGAYRWVVARGRAELDGTGKAKRFPGVIVDITARKTAENALRESEEHLRMATESARLGTWELEPLTGKLTWSDNCRAMFGLPLGAEVSYPVFLQALHPEDRARVAAAASQAMQAGSDGLFDTEFRVIGLQDGIERWVASRGRAFFDEYGRATRFIGTMLDITARKRAEEAAIRRSAQLQELTSIATRVNAAHDVASVLGIITEEARNLISAQQAVASVTLDEHQKEPVTVISHCDKANPQSAGVSAPGVSSLAALLAQTRAPVRITRADLEREPNLGELSSQPTRNGWMAVPLVGRNTRNLGVIQLSDKHADEFTADDEALLTQLAHIAAGAIENARLYQELREKDQRKDEFLAMLAHELRNPLAAMRNAVVLGSSTTDMQEIGWSLDVIQRQLRQLTRLIDDLLDVSRITQGKIQLRKEFIDAGTLLNSAVEAVQPLIEERQHELTVSFRHGALPLEADPARLEQIVVNLLTNAAKYTESGGEISLRAKHENGQIVIRIKDNGTGIPPEKLPQMFELFAQGDRTLARSEGGLGIGLTLVRSLAEMHGGSVEARSEGLDRGSEFIVRLPASATAAATTAAKSATPPGGFMPKPAALAPAPVATKKSVRVLVVDDNADSARATAMILTREGHDVKLAYDGPAAIEAAKQHLPEVVLLDIGLPGMDGYGVAACLRQEESLKNVVIIAVSGYGQQEDRRRSREAGFDHHLVKPVDYDALLPLLTSAK